MCLRSIYFFDYFCFPAQLVGGLPSAGFLNKLGSHVLFLLPAGTCSHFYHAEGSESPLLVDLLSTSWISIYRNIWYDRVQHARFRYPVPPILPSQSFHFSRSPYWHLVSLSFDTSERKGLLSTCPISVWLLLSTLYIFDTSISISSPFPSRSCDPTPLPFRHVNDIIVQHFHPPSSNRQRLNTSTRKMCPGWPFDVVIDGFLAFSRLSSAQVVAGPNISELATAMPSGVLNFLLRCLRAGGRARGHRLDGKLRSTRFIASSI